jgi:hypothetical protein
MYDSGAHNFICHDLVYMSCGKNEIKYIYRILPAISKICPAFGHWQPAISSPAPVYSDLHV